MRIKRISAFNKTSGGRAVFTISFELLPVLAFHTDLNLSAPSNSKAKLKESTRMFKTYCASVVVQFQLSSKIPLDYRTASRSDRIQHSIISKPHLGDLN